MKCIEQLLKLDLFLFHMGYGLCIRVFLNPCNGSIQGEVGLFKALDVLGEVLLNFVDHIRFRVEVIPFSQDDLACEVPFGHALKGPRKVDQGPADAVGHDEKVHKKEGEEDENRGDKALGQDEKGLGGAILDVRIGGAEHVSNHRQKGKGQGDDQHAGHVPDAYQEDPKLQGPVNKEVSPLALVCFL